MMPLFFLCNANCSSANLTKINIIILSSCSVHSIFPSTTVGKSQSAVLVTWRGIWRRRLVSKCSTENQCNTHLHRSSAIDARSLFHRGPVDAGHSPLIPLRMLSIPLSWRRVQILYRWSLLYWRRLNRYYKSANCPCRPVWRVSTSVSSHRPIKWGMTHFLRHLTWVFECEK